MSHSPFIAFTERFSEQKENSLKQADVGSFFTELKQKLDENIFKCPRFENGQRDNLVKTGAFGEGGKKNGIEGGGVTDGLRKNLFGQEEREEEVGGEVGGREEKGDKEGVFRLDFDDLPQFFEPFSFD